MTEFLVWGLIVSMTFFLVRSRYQYRALPSLARWHSSSADVTIIIPARNEAHQIRRCIQSFPGARVLVIDDASTDNTSDAARVAGAEVLRAPALPPGAKGKPNACAAGASAASTKWILFVDADTWFEPGFAGSLVHYAEANHLRVVTAFLNQRCETFIEKALLPYAFALYFSGVSARRVNDPASAEALANGQCLLFERVAYDSIGGHAAVLDSVIEDVALAKLAKLRGLSLRVIRAEAVGSVRMYDSFAAIWSGFQKNSFRFLLINPGSGLQVVAASIVLTSWLPVLILAIRDAPPGVLPWPAVLLFLAPFVLLAPWYTAGTREFARALLAPLGIYLFQLIALNGMAATVFKRKTVWKQRHV